MTLPFTNLFGSGSTPVAPGGTYWWAASFIEAVSIPSAESWGTPSLGKVINPPSIPSEESWGNITLTYDQTIGVDGVIDEEVFGEPIVSHVEDQQLRTNSILSAEEWGSPSLIRGFVIEPPSIPSAEAWGNPTIPRPPAFDAVGSGASNNTNFETQFSWSHNGTASAYLIVDFVVDRPPPAGGPTVTYSGIPMTQLKVMDVGDVSNFGPGRFYRYGLANIPGGVKTVSVTNVGQSSYYSANSRSYLGVSSIGAAESTTVATGNALSQSTTTTSAQLAVQAFAGDSTGQSSASGGFNTLVGGTNRYNASSKNAQLSLSESDAAATTFTAQGIGDSSAAQYWVACIHKLLANVPQINVPSIPSAEAWGAPTFLVAGPQTVEPTGIPSAESWGTPSLGQAVTATSIPSGESWGTPVVRPVITPTSIPSAEAWGIPKLNLNISPTSIPSGESFGTPSVAQVITPTSIPSAEAFGTPTLANASTVAFDAVGAGAHNALGTTLSWSHTAAAGATVLAFISVGDAGFSAVTSITHDGNAMTLVGRMNDNNTNGAGYIALYKISGVAAGAKTISVTLGSQAQIDGNSVSFLNVGTVGSAITAFGSSTALTQTVTMSGQPMCVQGFGVFRGTIATASGGTNRHRANTLSISTATATTTFTATDATSTEYGGVAALLS